MTMLEKFIEQIQIEQDYSRIAEIRYRIYVLSATLDAKNELNNCITLDDCMNHRACLLTVFQTMLIETKNSNGNDHDSLNDYYFYSYKKLNCIRSAEQYKVDVLATLNGFMGKWSDYRENHLKLLIGGKNERTK